MSHQLDLAFLEQPIDRHRLSPHARTPHSASRNQERPWSKCVKLWGRLLLPPLTASHRQKTIALTNSTPTRPAKKKHPDDDIYGRAGHGVRLAFELEFTEMSYEMEMPLLSGDCGSS